MSVSRSEIDGSRDGSPTFFEVPLSATKCPRIIMNPHFSKRLSCLNSFRWNFVVKNVPWRCIDPLPGLTSTLQFDVEPLESLRYFISVYAPVNSATLICKLTGKFGILGNISNQLRLLELLLSSLVMWHDVVVSFRQLRTALTICSAQKFLLHCLLARLTPLAFFQISVPSHGRGKMVDLRRGKGFVEPRLERCQQDEEQRVNHPIHRQLTEMQVQISWDAAGYFPTGHIS